MTDSSPPSTPDRQFCGECGTALEPEATFCGECGAAVAADAEAEAPDAAEADEPGGGPGGASDWSGVTTVVDRGDAPPASSLPPPTAPPVTVPVPNVPPPPGPSAKAAADAPPSAAPGGPPGAGGPPGGGGPGGPGGDAATGKGGGKKVLIGVLVLLALVAGAFFVLGGDDGGGDEDADPTFQRDDDDDDPDDDDEETTTTAEGDEETTTTAEGDEDGFVNLVDETGRISVDVPADWTDVSLAPDDELPRILAAPDAQAFETGFTEPGLDLRLLNQVLAPEQFDTSLDTVANTIGLPNSCTSQGKEDYTDGVFTGRMEVWGECAGIGTEMALLFARQEDGQTVFLGLQLTAEDDPAIAERVAASFRIVG